MEERTEEVVKRRLDMIAGMGPTFTSADLRKQFDCAPWVATEVVLFGYQEKWLTRKRHGGVFHYTKTPLFERLLKGEEVESVDRRGPDEGRTLGRHMAVGLLGFKNLAELRRLRPGA